MSKQIDSNNITYLAFVDLEMVVDTVKWNKMFFTLREIGVDEHDLIIIYSL